EAIRSGFQQLQPASNFDRLFYAGSSRAIGDWLLGMNATRLYTLKYGGFKQVLSIGRVQTPTLAMLVKRHKEIEAFVPKPYWELQTLYREVLFQCESGRFYKKEEGEVLLQKVTDQIFTILSFTKKQGKEQPPRLFDLTALQVHCNKRFGFSADQSLKLVQKLYEQKLVTYPRVDTTYLPNDLYPKIAGILGKLSNYQSFTKSLLGKTIRKSGKVFNDKKVTDHHAIIPTGVEKSLALNEQKVYDAITRRFIAAFYPDCLVAHTTVIGASNQVKFKATGKEILDPGWRVLYPKTQSNKNQKTKTEKGKETDKKESEERILPTFKKGESGPHQPSLVEKETKPPKKYTEASLLRAMETAGKQVDDDALRELMKANGIGRPSTRANIIETLFKRKYIRRQKKLILPTDTGIELIDTIQNELLKSAELTGQWEKQLRDIESGSYSAKQFIANMSDMVSKLIEEVRLEKTNKRISGAHSSKAKYSNTYQKKRAGTKTQAQSPASKKIPSSSKKSNQQILVEQHCPKCRKGQLLKGKTAYGCSQWKSGCDFRLPFSFMDKKLPERQLLRLMKHGATIQLKGFKANGRKKNGQVRFNDACELYLAEKDDPTSTRKPRTPSANKTTSKKAKTKSTAKVPDQLSCPKCGVGKVIKGKSAYGCSHWQTGCQFRLPFEEVRLKAGDRLIDKSFVWELLEELR
ncbi:MAG: DNA topoisomerase, partial [Bacteroidota bacterium]